MFRSLFALAILASAGCGSGSHQQCALNVTGTGTPADTTYNCSTVSANYNVPSQRGSIAGFASTGILTGASGPHVVMTLTLNGPPSETVYTDGTLPPGASYDVTLAENGVTMWEAVPGSGAFRLEVRKLNDSANSYGLDIGWPVLTGSLAATLKPSAGNPAQTDAVVTMDF
jgi:hypothetical protein